MTDAISQENTAADMVELATALTVAWLSNTNNRVAADDVTAFLGTMHQTLGTLIGSGTSDLATAPAVPDYSPAVSVRKSLASRDHIISMIDGKPYRTLTRHLSTKGLTPDEYRARYGLKSDYPMTAPGYSESRSAMAKALGFGRKPRSAAPAAADPAPKPAPRGRRKVTA